MYIILSVNVLLIITLLILFIKIRDRFILISIYGLLSIMGYRSIDYFFRINGSLSLSIRKEIIALSLIFIAMILISGIIPILFKKIRGAQIILLPSVLFIGSMASLFYTKVSIIDFVWFLLLSIGNAGTLFLADLFLKLDTLSNGKKLKCEGISEFIYDEINKFLKLIIQAYLAVGASVGVSMSILYQNAGGNWYNTDLLNGSYSMVTGFLLLGCSLFLWVLPQYYKITHRVYDYYILSMSKR